MSGEKFILNLANEKKKIGGQFDPTTHETSNDKAYLVEPSEGQD